MLWLSVRFTKAAATASSMTSCLACAALAILLASTILIYCLLDIARGDPVNRHSELLMVINKVVTQMR